MQLGGAIGNVLTPSIELVSLPMTLAGLVLHVGFPIRIAAELVALVDRGAAALATSRRSGR